jgi:hypothetical protein
MEREYVKYKYLQNHFAIVSRTRCKRESSYSFPPASFVDPTRAGLTETGRRRRRSMSAWKLRGHARTPTTPHTSPFPLALFLAWFPLPATALCSLNIAARGIDRLPHPQLSLSFRTHPCAHCARSCRAGRGRRPASLGNSDRGCAHCSATCVILIRSASRVCSERFTTVNSCWTGK